jgi:hypothetical protein
MVIEGQQRNVCSRKYCLNCSPWGARNTRTLERARGLERVAHTLPESKRCPRCGIEKPIADFYLRPGGERSHHWCKICNNEHRKARFREDRRAALDHYGHGDPRCACCGEALFEFLALDHVNNDGGAHRRQLGVTGGAGFYAWLRKTGYTYDGLVVACHNCNLARAMYGRCPHNTAP